MNVLHWLYDAQLDRRRPPDHLARDPRQRLRLRVGASAGMRRTVWAWPVGIVGNVLLFSVFIAATFEADAQQPLFGQAGRQVFFIITSVYGWWRWRQVKSHRDRSPRPAITPALGDRGRAARLPRRLGRRGPGVPVAVLA